MGAVGYRVDAAGHLTEVGRISHTGRDQSPLSPSSSPSAYPFDAAVHRALVVGDRLYSVSERGVLASDLGTLADQTWMPYPAG